MGLTAKRWARRAGMIAALGALAIFLSACTDFNVRTAMPPDAATTQGQASRNLYDIVFVIGAAIFLVVEGLILFAVLRYDPDRARPRALRPLVADAQHR